MRSTYEKPQHKNPHRLTVNQHVFPLMSIARFADSSGAKPDDPMFVARRAWDHRAEVGYMKRIENAFQELAAKIIAGTVSEIGNAEKAIVKDFCALWYARARHRNLPRQEIQAKGITGGGNLTLDQEEMAERNGYIFMRTGGRWPARQLNGMRIQSLIYRQFDCLSSAKWGIILAQEGEFLVPDVPERAMVPLTPTLCLMSPSPNGLIPKQGVAEINRLSRESCLFLRPRFFEMPVLGFVQNSSRRVKSPGY